MKPASLSSQTNRGRLTRSFSRRSFLRTGVAGAGWVGLSSWLGQANWLARADAANPFAYDLGNLARTNPALICYRELKQYKCRLNGPQRLGMGPSDELYVAAKNRVGVLDSAGESVREIPLTASARAVAVARDGTTYVSLRDHIEVFDAKGQRLASWASPGRRTWITGLAVGRDGVFAADAGGRVIDHYDRKGQLRSRIGERNQARNIPGFIIPSPYFDVKLPKDGLLRATNPGRHQIEAYTVAGDLEFAWGKASAAIEGFCGCCNPISLALTPDGKYITCEKGLPRVKVYAEHGKFIGVVAGPETFPENLKAGSESNGVRAGLDVAVDSQGRVYVLDQVTARIHVFVSKTAKPA